MEPPRSAARARARTSRFDFKGRELAAAALKQAGLSRLSVDAKGTSTTDRLDVNATVTSPEGLNAKAVGAIPLDGGALDLDVNLAEFPLATLNAVVPGQDLAGKVTANAKVTGTLAKPAAQFVLRGADIAATPLRSAGLAPLRVLAEGSFANDVVTLTSAEAGGPGGFRMTATGRVPVAGGEQIALDVNLNAFPLAAANSVAPGTGPRRHHHRHGAGGRYAAQPVGQFQPEWRRIARCAIERSRSRADRAQRRRQLRQQRAQPEFRQRARSAGICADRQRPCAAAPAAA